MEKCPTCEKKLNSVYDYPKIEIKEFKRLQIPNFIFGNDVKDYALGFFREGRARIPVKFVRKQFKPGVARVNYGQLTFERQGLESKHIKGGRNYHDRFNELLGNEYLQKYLSNLEGSVDKEMNTKSHLYDGRIYIAANYPKNGIVLEIENLPQGSSSFSKFGINMIGETFDDGKSKMYFNDAKANIASVSYIGKLNS
jgi:hypothetical protein